MKKLMSLVALFCTLSAPVLAVNKVIYGEDNRRDQYEVIDQTKLDLQKSTLAMISKSRLRKYDNDSYRTTDSKIELCDGERFNKQVDVADCSGFLVEKNNKQYVITAGHCATSNRDCHDNYWVFDYVKTSPRDDARTIKASNVYKCSRIVAQKLSDRSGIDFAVIELNREAQDRTPLKFRKKGDIRKGEDVFVIGHPSGLPSKVADGAYVRDARDFYSFQTNLDTFAGNSGSAVFNESTGVLEGILVRGDEDYLYNAKENCYEANHCKMDSCGGEDVFRITRINFLKD